MEITMLCITSLRNDLNKEKIYIIKISSFILLIILIYIFENPKYHSRIIQKKNAIKYINDIYKNHLNNDFDIKSFNENPKISVIIPLYNCQNSINMSLYSVQMQDFKNIEIILINDFSFDNTIQIVNEFKLKDKRIRIINNKKNMGTLYSRSIGVLSAKGENILCLDNDDIFYDGHLFENILRIKESNNYEIVEFKSFYVKKFDNLFKLSEIKDSPFNNHPNNFKLSQLKLGIFPISKNDKYL